MQKMWKWSYISLRSCKAEDNSTPWKKGPYRVFSISIWNWQVSKLGYYKTKPIEEGEKWPQLVAPGAWMDALNLRAPYIIHIVDWRPKPTKISRASPGPSLRLGPQAMFHFCGLPPQKNPMDQQDQMSPSTKNIGMFPSVGFSFPVKKAKFRHVTNIFRCIEHAWPSTQILKTNMQQKSLKQKITYPNARKQQAAIWVPGLEASFCSATA